MSQSRYLPDVVAFAVSMKAKAAYAFVVEGVQGTGGCPVVIGANSREEYRTRCLELVQLLRRSADLLERDVDRQVPPPAVTS